MAALVAWYESGLSPRTRGNLAQAFSLSGEDGSIPANAGEPKPSVRGQRRAQVYPRERGGTYLMCKSPRWLPGLSPRTRGNQSDPRQPDLFDGSIPANAGEPTCRVCIWLAGRVYPRERGGTVVGGEGCRWSGGLSPRTRGNPVEAQAEDAIPRSIPANAGEPIPSWCCAATARVYPRERGGTNLFGRSIRLHRGLSPRTRGNPDIKARRIRPFGSIPANAGEPSAGGTWRTRWRVYPRERGGTSERLKAAFAKAGLSPRTRGNLFQHARLLLFRGSIPANAGEPV